MNWNQLIFDVFPYVALTVAVIDHPVYRWRAQPFTVVVVCRRSSSSAASCFWGSIPFHYGHPDRSAGAPRGS